MLRTFAIALLATVMSVGMAQAAAAFSAGMLRHGHKLLGAHPLTFCENNRQVAATCACGPAKTVCPKGMWCHSFTSTCTP
jgi:hypothetical protein